METLEDIMYHTPRALRVRQKPMQVLALGVSRSGTESLRNALLQLGYDHTYHGFDIADGDTEAWVRLTRRKYGIGSRAAAALRENNGEAGITAEDFDAIIGHCVATTDLPGVGFAPELIAAYPDAKIILNTRKDLDAWHQSIKTTLGTTRATRLQFWRRYFCANLYWLHCIYDELFDGFFCGSVELNGKWVYREHCAKIRGMVPKENLLEWSVEDGWEPLCAFLGKPTEGHGEFPNGNAPAEFMKKIFELSRESDATMRKNMSITAGVIAVVSFIAFAVFKRL